LAGPGARGAFGRDALLLHSCCAPCSTVTVPAWRAEGLAPAAFFHNPNIAPGAEYRRRLTAMQALAAALDLPLEVGAGPDEVCLVADGPAPDRCRLCIGRRLDATALRARELGVPRFATTLALSPYQPHDVIRVCGEEAAARHGVEFLYADQRRLFGRHYDECRRLGLYRQPYCGCVASKWEAWHDRRERKLRRAG
jgi:epoxyqueuosine reductase